MGKSTSMPPAIEYQEAPDPMETMGPMLMAMQESMLMMTEAMMNQPALPAMPAIQQPDPIDWDSHYKDLEEKARIKEEEAAKRRRGHSSTILTSPLLDEETPNVLELNLMSGSE
jgi:hypothetical protein